jgi:hypothetical protein
MPMELCVEAMFGTLQNEFFSAAPCVQLGCIVDWGLKYYNPMEDNWKYPSKL